MARGTLTSGVIIPRVHRLVCGKKLRARAFLHQEAEIEQVTSAEAIKSVYREPRTEQRMYNSAERVPHSCVSTKPSDLLSRLLETSSDVVRLEAINRKLDYEFGADQPNSAKSADSVAAERKFPPVDVSLELILIGD